MNKLHFPESLSHLPIAINPNFQYPIYLKFDRSCIAGWATLKEYDGNIMVDSDYPLFEGSCFGAGVTVNHDTEYKPTDFIIECIGVIIKPVEDESKKIESAD